MAQQVSLEDAFPVFRDRCRELHDENLILRAQAAALERQLGELHAENEQLKAAPPASAPVAQAGSYEPPQAYTDVDVTE